MLRKKSTVSWGLHTPRLPHPHASLPHFPTWFRVLCDFCIQARHWSYRRKLRFEQYACFLSQPRNCLSSRRTGPELGSPPRGSHTPPPGPGRSKESEAAVSGRGRQGAHADGTANSQTRPQQRESWEGCQVWTRASSSRMALPQRCKRTRRIKLVGSKTGYSVGNEKKKWKLGGVRPGQKEKVKVPGGPQSLGERAPSVTPALGRLKHDCCEVKPSLGYL